MTRVPYSMQKSPPDPEYERLRAHWYATKGDEVAHILANNAISAYVWDKACRQVAEDRAKHPKAKRNAPVPARDPDEQHPSRQLP